MYDNVRFTVANALDRERKKVNKSDKISNVRTDFKKHDEGSGFKETYEEAKRKHNIESEDAVIIDSSLSKKIEENKVIEKLVDERIMHNPLFNEIFNDSINEPLKAEEGMIIDVTR
jgi:hypothetical protein